jgi:hypothetical protein
MKAASLFLLCAASLAASPCFAQNSAVAPRAAQQSSRSRIRYTNPGYANAPQGAALQNSAGYAFGSTLGVGAEPSDMTVSTEPSNLHVGIEPSTLYVGIEPSSLYVGIESSTLHVGIEPSTLSIGTEPSSLYIGIEPSFPPYVGLMPPFAPTPVPPFAPAPPFLPTRR